MLTLKLQYFGHLMRRVDSFEKTLMLGGIGGRMYSTTIQFKTEKTIAVDTASIYEDKVVQGQFIQ